MLEPLLWISGLFALLLGGAVAAALLMPLRFGPEMAAAVLYTCWMILMVFFPGRGQRGRNPFGAASRRVAVPLVLTHLAALAVLLPAVAAGLVVRARYAPRWLFGVSVVFGLALTLWQFLRSAALLEKAEVEEPNRSAAHAAQPGAARSTRWCER